MRIIDLGLIPYRNAWKIQEETHGEEQVMEGGEETLLLLEHTPVITFGRRVANAQKNLLAGAKLLKQMGVEVVESDRGGDITFHGPGQLVAYPIVRLNDHRLSVGGYVRKLEEAVIAAYGGVWVRAYKDDCAIGVWVDLPSQVESDRVACPHEPPSSIELENGVVGSGGHAGGERRRPRPLVKVLTRVQASRRRARAWHPRKRASLPSFSSAKICRWAFA